MSSFEKRFLKTPEQQAAEQAAERAKQQRDEMAEQLDKAKEGESSQNES